MRNCFVADLFRVQRKKAYLICISITFALMIFASILAGTKVLRGDVSENYSLFVSLAVSFNSLLIGIPVFSAVLSDDFKSRSMQTAIGRGMSRTKLIITRFLEFILILFEAYVILTIFDFGLGMIFDIDPHDIKVVAFQMWVESAFIICCFAVAMIFVYLKQTGTVGLVVYILLACNALELAFTGLSQIKFFKDHDINLVDYTIDGMKSSVLDTTNSTSTRVSWALMMLVCFIIIPLLLTTRIFKKKELEF